MGPMLASLTARRGHPPRRAGRAELRSFASRARPSLPEAPVRAAMTAIVVGIGQDARGGRRRRALRSRACSRTRTRGPRARGRVDRTRARGAAPLVRDRGRVVGGGPPGTVIRIAVDAPRGPDRRRCRHMASPSPRPSRSHASSMARSRSRSWAWLNSSRPRIVAKGGRRPSPPRSNPPPRWRSARLRRPDGMTSRRVTTRLRSPVSSRRFAVQSAVVEAEPGNSAGDP